MIKFIGLMLMFNACAIFNNLSVKKFDTFGCLKKCINTSMILGLKNDYLRLILSHSTNKIKQKINIIKRIINRNIFAKYNTLFSKYYDLTYDYYSISEDEKTIIEFIISLTY